MTIFGDNVLKVDDKAAYKAHLQKWQPPAVLFYEIELDYAREIKQAFPNMEVILRFWPDGDVYKRLTPEQWLNQHEAQAAGGLTLYTTNEAGLGQDVIDWHLDLMKRAAFRGVKLCLLNPATGTWDLPDLPRLRPLLVLASTHRDLFVIGLHTYAGGIITSGIRGGNPDNAGVQIGQPGGLNLVNRENWSQVKPTDTFFHIGRHKILTNFCKGLDLNPRFGLTEIGFDFTSDIGAWLNAIGQRTGQTSVNGWRSLISYWREIFPDWSPEMAYVKQFEWAEKTLLDGVDFGLFFAHGDDGNWGNYNIANSAIPALFEADATAIATQPAPIVTQPVNAPEKPDSSPAQPVTTGNSSDKPTTPALDTAAIRMKLQALKLALGTLTDEVDTLLNSLPA